MPIECKYCGYEESFWNLFWTKLTTGHFPECEGCGADDDTLEIALDR